VKGLRGAGWLLLAVGGGVAWGLQFGRQGYLVAPWLALAPLFLLLGHRRPGRLAFVHGLAAWLAAIPWIAPTLHTYGQFPPALALLSLLLLASYLAAFEAAWARLGAPLWRLPGWRGVVAALAGLPALWVALEWVRAWLLSGFPWNLAAYSWVEVPGALPLTAWIGAYGLSALVLAANAGVALAVARRRWEPACLGLLAPSLLLALGGRWATGSSPEPAAGRPVRLLQPNSENLVAWDPEAVRRNYDKVFSLSRTACDRPGALLVWPESAAWPYSYSAHDEFRRDVDALAATGCPVLLNSTHQDPEGRWYNSGLLVAPGRPVARYDKRHLVPFGEYVPLARFLPFIESLARNAGDFSAAEELRLLPWEGEEIGLAICFEVVFPAEVAEAVVSGASLLATITNDAWYGDTSAPWQHLRAARFRAAESRRPLLRAAITGVSAVIAADGSVVAQLGVGEEGILRASVAGRRDLSPASRWPWASPVAALVVGAVAILWAVRPWERPPHSPTSRRASSA
jgi:apolipoprotein N-acyltransferase